MEGENTLLVLCMLCMETTP